MQERGESQLKGIRQVEILNMHHHLKEQLVRLVDSERFWACGFFDTVCNGCREWMESGKIWKFVRSHIDLYIRSQRCHKNGMVLLLSLLEQAITDADFRCLFEISKYLEIWKFSIAPNSPVAGWFQKAQNVFQMWLLHWIICVVQSKLYWLYCIAPLLFAWTIANYSSHPEGPTWIEGDSSLNAFGSIQHVLNSPYLKTNDGMPSK